ncbi:MAG: phosphoglucosamine mutase [Candidatus Marinimicrobia bacterium]|nr:phosphoglucosamine mutase [Candidatus Neomarinimicrobiota bacterium]
MTLIRGISGIRGIVDDGLNAEVVSDHMKAFSQLQPEGTILVARDSRIHGAKLIEAACFALATSGREVINCDIIPTPTAQFLIEKNGYAGGIVITASHNPTEWNGMKFIDNDGCFLDANKNSRLFNLADEAESLEEGAVGTITEDQSGIKLHITHTTQLSVVDTKSIQHRKFKVVVDAVNGGAAIALPQMVEALGCDLVTINCTPNGKFPRGAEPLPQNLKQLGDAVIKHGADVGFATDPDGDRLAVVDELGNPLGEEYTLTICADGILSTHDIATPLVTNLSTTMALDKVCEKYKNRVARSSVGEINVVNLMKEKNSVLGGEGNGGVILPESHYGRDSLVGAALFLNRMSQTDNSVSKIFASMPQFYMVKDKIELGDINPNKALYIISETFKDCEHNTMDGLKLIWDNSWAHIRKSNTEPIIRIYAEATSVKAAKELVTNIKRCIQ